MIEVVYYESNGRISAVKTIQQGTEELNCPPASQWFICSRPVNPADKYVVVGTHGPELFSRPAMPITHGDLTVVIDEPVTVSDIPAGAVLSHPDGEDTIEDGALEWSCAVPGIFVLTLSKFPYLEARLRVQVNPA